jgi:hypothetical protein
VRREALRLRSDGFSPTAILSKIGIPMSTTVQWCKFCGIEEGGYLSDEDLDIAMRDWKERYASDGGKLAVMAPPPSRRALALDRGKLGEVVAEAKARVVGMYKGEDTIAGVLKAATAMALLASWEESMLDLPRVEKWADVKTMLDTLFAKLGISEKAKEVKRQGIDIRILNTPRNRQAPVDVEATFSEE